MVLVSFGQVNLVDVDDEEMPKGVSQDYNFDSPPLSEADIKVQDERLF